MAEEILGSANLPDTMNVDDMLLQAMIAASLCDDKKRETRQQEETMIGLSQLNTHTQPCV